MSILALFYFCIFWIVCLQAISFHYSLYEHSDFFFRTTFFSPSSILSTFCCLFICCLLLLLLLLLPRCCDCECVGEFDGWYTIRMRIMVCTAALHTAVVGHTSFHIWNRLNFDWNELILFLLVEANTHILKSMLSINNPPPLLSLAFEGGLATFNRPNTIAFAAKRRTSNIKLL